MLDKGTKKRDAPFGTSLLNCATFALLSADRREGEGLVAHPFNFRKGEQVDCLTSNAHRISPIGEWDVAPGDKIELELLRGSEWL